VLGRILGCIFKIENYSLLQLTFDHLQLNYSICYWFNHEKQEKLLRAWPVSFKKNLNEPPTRQFQKVTGKERNLLR